MLPPANLRVCWLHVGRRRLRIGCRVFGRNPVEDDDAVRQVRGHDEVVLHHERRLLGVQDIPAAHARVSRARDAHAHTEALAKDIAPPHPHPFHSSFLVVMHVRPSVNLH